MHFADTEHQFNAREPYWGFTEFMRLSELNEPVRGYLTDDTCTIEADVTVCRVFFFFFGFDICRVVDYWSLLKKI